MASGLTKSRKNLLLTILAVIAIIAGIALVVLQVLNVRDLRQQAEEEQLALDSSRAMLARRQEHRENAPAYRERIAVYEQMVPGEPGEEQILRYFDLLSDEYDIRVIEIRFDNREINEDPGYVRMPLTVTLEGRYQDLIGLLGHLRDSGRAVRVNDVRITLTQDPPARVRIVLTASAFYSSLE
jgi:Tfp pilus assembly protein PilO